MLALNERENLHAGAAFGEQSSEPEVSATFVRMVNYC